MNKISKIQICFIKIVYYNFGYYCKTRRKDKNEITTRLNELIRLLFLMEDRVNFLNKITEEKKMISSEIREIDETLNDKEKLKKNILIETLNF